METINERISVLFDESGLTIRDLAEAAGCSKSAMQRYITGDRNVPTPVVEGLAKAFNVHPAYIFGWVDDRHYSVKKEKPVDSNDELSAKKRAFIERVKQMSDSELDRLDQILRIVENTK